MNRREKKRLERGMMWTLTAVVIAMFAVLVLQFDSFRHATYVLSVVPLSLIGILVGLAITGKALSFPSMMGFIALSGIVVNNSIILIDAMNRLRRSGGMPTSGRLWSRRRSHACARSS